jgi:hypothetical protein
MSKSVSKTVRIDDMFDDYVNEKQPMYLRNLKESGDNQKKQDIQQKIEVAKCETSMNKLILITRLSLVAGPIYIAIMLEIIRLHKTLFALKLEEGIENEIPKGIVI